MAAPIAKLDALFAQPDAATYDRVLRLADSLHGVVSDRELAAFLDEAHARMARLPAAWRVQPAGWYEPWLAPLMYELSDLDLQANARWPDAPLPHLERLTLGTATARDWVTAPDGEFPALRALRVDGRKRGADLLAWLARQRFPALAELELRECAGLQAAMEALQRAWDWSRLTRAFVFDCVVGDGLATWTSPAAMRSLTIANAALGAASAAALAASAFPALERLVLIDGTVGSAAALAHLDAPSLSHVELRYLRLAGAERWDELATAAWPQLRALDVEIAAPDPGGALARTVARFSRLRHLNLEGCGLDDRGVAELAAAPLSQLLSLSLGESRCSAAGLRALAQADLPTLRDLDLLGTPLDRAAVEALVAAPWWPRLRRLGLHRTSLTPDAIDVLVSAPPTKLELLGLDRDVIERERQRLAAAFTARIADFDMGWSIRGEPHGYGRIVAADELAG